MKILVTGATGVIGRRLVPLLIAAHHEVTAVARTSWVRGRGVDAFASYFERQAARRIGLDTSVRQRARRLACSCQDARFSRYSWPAPSF